MTESATATTEPAVRVYIVDDHRTLADAIALGIGARPDLAFAGSATSVGDALRGIAETEPDVVIMDVGLGGGTDGIAGTKQVKELRPQTRVLVLTGLGDLNLLGRALDAGASGFLRKTGPLGELLDTALAVARGDQIVVDRAVVTEALARVAPGFQHRGVRANGGLTEREFEVLGMLAEGIGVTAIAAALGISPHTCRGHVKNILAKLETHSRLEAIAVARQRGLLN